MIRSVYDLFFILGLVLLLFITESTGNFLGISQITTFSTSLITFLSFNFIIKNSQVFSFKENRSVLIYIVIVFLVTVQEFLFRGLSDGLNFLKGWLPLVLILILLENSFKYRKKIVTNVLITFFIIECALGIFERVTLTSVFVDIVDGSTFLDSEESSEFRASSLLGHPLNNAHQISIMLGIILISQLKNSFKVFAYILAFLAILSFNARAATIIVVLLYPLVVYSLNKSGTRRQVRRLVTFSLMIFVCLLYVLFTTNLGGRLIFGEKLIDGSALTRIQAFDMLNSFLSSENLLIGLGDLKAEQTTENGYINLILIHGLIAAILIIFAQVKIVLSRIRNFKPLEKLIIFSTFFLVGFSNNAFASYSPLLMFCIWITIIDVNNYLSEESKNPIDSSLIRFKKFR